MEGSCFLKDFYPIHCFSKHPRNDHGEVRFKIEIKKERKAKGVCQRLSIVYKSDQTITG